MGRLIVILAVIRLKNHHLLVTREGFFDMSNSVVEFHLDIPCLLLHGISTLVERQNKNIHCKAQEDNGNSGIVNKGIGNLEYKLKNYLQRPYKKCF